MTMLAGTRSRWQRSGPRVRDAAFVVLSALVTLAYLASAPGTTKQVLVAVFGTLGTIAVWFRRRYPVAVVLAGIAVILLCRVPAPLAIGLFSLAVRRRDRVLAVMTIGAAVAHAFDAGVGSGVSWLGQIIAGVLSAGFCAATGSYIGARHDLVASLRERADRAEQERELRAEQARIAERTRIAREMHDVLAHKVSLIALHAGALEVSAAPGARQVQQTAELIRTTARQAMEDLREVLGVLHSGEATAGGELAPQPGAADIERIVDSSRAAGVRVELAMDPTVHVEELPETIARTAYRVVQEGLTNVHKHARGAATRVTLRGGRNVGVTVEVVNQRPVSATTLLPGSGAGLVGLRERIALIGGTMQCGPQSDGWRLSAWLPWEAM